MVGISRKLNKVGVQFQGFDENICKAHDKIQIFNTNAVLTKMY